MIKVLAGSLNFLKIDLVNRFKSLWVVTTLDGGEDYLVSERVIPLIGSHLKEFQNLLDEKRES